MHNNSHIAYLFALALAMSSCGQSEETPTATTDMPICWDIVSVDGMKNSRVMIGSGQNEMNLQTACTDNEAIAVWGDYTYNNNDYQAFANTPLTYSSDVWKYTGGYRYWISNSLYRFRAYYPKQALGSNASATNANSVTITYDTEALQEDLLVAYKEINTATWDLSKAVPLEMKHALAAVRFQFQSVDGVQMVLKSFALQNTIEEGTVKGLGTSGTLTYQGESVDLSNWTVTSPFPSDKLYDWQHDGVQFGNAPVAAYQKTGNTPDNFYTDNDGYVLLIPQEYNGKTNMIFETNNKPTPFEVVLPAPTSPEEKKFLPGHRYTYLIKVTADNAVTLTCTVQPWTLQEEEMDFKDYVNVDADGQLEWLSGSVEEKSDNVNEVFLNAETIQCRFRIATPIGATWYATLVPVDGNDMNAFAFVDSNGNETGLSISGKVGETATLTIKRKTIKELTRMRLQLIVKDANGRTFMVSKEVLGSENYIWCQP